MGHYNGILFYSAIMMGFVLIFSNSCKKDNNTAPTPTPTSNTVTDVDGNVYHAITIGSQVWMVENLKTTKYRNGDPISYVADSTAWSNQIAGTYCNYNNDANNSATYGRLYNWYAVDDNRNIAPVGWHIPTDAEWTALTTYLGGDSIAGGKLKETGTTHWQSPNTGATNKLNFTALPGGFRSYNGSYNYVGGCGYWWSSTEQDSVSAWCRGMYYGGGSIGRDSGSKPDGFSVRCVKD